MTDKEKQDQNDDKHKERMIKKARARRHDEVQQLRSYYQRLQYVGISN
ncbi:MAG: hypothetical protein PVI42_19130 [Desulfobacterales bacterium]